MRNWHYAFKEQQRTGPATEALSSADPGARPQSDPVPVPKQPASSALYECKPWSSLRLDTRSVGVASAR
jgi:hypothetical protein